MKLTVTLFAAVLLCATTATAQQIRFTDFSVVTNLQFNGSAHQATGSTQKVLRLTDGVARVGAPHHPEAATSFFGVRQPVTNGFTTYFAFQMHNSTPNGPAEGLAFLVQNSQQTDHTMGATGAGITALGAGADPTTFGGMGYAGIYDSIAVEFDIAQQSWDPNSNHAAIQSCGTGVNTPVHLPGTYTIGQNHDVTSCLVSNAITNTARLANGSTHQVVIEYDPGTLQVWLDPQFIVGTHTPSPTSPPILNIPYTIDGLSLADGKAFVGFSASQSMNVTAQDILAWEFTPHTPLAVQEQITNDGTTNTFTFGGHDATVTYPAGSNPNGDFMTVLATPVDPVTFYNARLRGTQFANETCITYLETGGNCMLYSVTCQASDGVTPVTCPMVLSPPFIALTTSFYTAQPVTNGDADYLKADPIGTNNWITICDRPPDPIPCYDPNIFDGTTSGKGKDLSDLVATFVAGGQQQLIAEPPRRVTIEAKR